MKNEMIDPLENVTVLFVPPQLNAALQPSLYVSAFA